jgi:hypothetical protein
MRDLATLEARQYQIPVAGDPQLYIPYQAQHVSRRVQVAGGLLLRLGFVE